MEGDYFTPKLRLFVLGGNNWNSLVRHALQPVCVCALVFFFSLSNPSTSWCCVLIDSVMAQSEASTQTGRRGGVRLEGRIFSLPLRSFSCQTTRAYVVNRA